MTAAQEAGTTLMALLNKSFSQAQSAPAPVQPPEVKP